MGKKKCWKIQWQSLFLFAKCGKPIHKNVNSSRNVTGCIQGNLDFILDITDVKSIPNR